MHVLSGFFGRITAVVLPFVVVISAGCASKRPNVQPFAEQTVLMLADLRAGLRNTQIMELRSHAEAEEVLRVTELWTTVSDLLRSVAAYSIEVVTTIEAEADGSAPIIAVSLTNLIDAFSDQEIVELHLNNERIGEIIENVRSQSTELTALQAAQPAVDEAARIASEILNILDRKHGEMMTAIGDRIDDEFDAVLRVEADLRDDQTSWLIVTGLIRDYRAGDESVLPELGAAMRMARIRISSTERISDQELDRLEQTALKELTQIHQFREQLRPDLEQHRAQQLELDQLARAADVAYQKASITVLAWSRAHRRLSLGMKVGGFMNLTRTVVGVAL